MDDCFDDNYKMVKVTGTNTDINSKDVTVTKMDTPAWDTDTNYKNVDDETVRYHYDNFTSNDYYLVNTSGNIQKNKLSGLKDGNECYYYVDKDMHVVLYTDNKTLKNQKGSDYTVSKNDGQAFIDGYIKK